MALHSEPSAIALAGQITRGELSALEACDAAIARIERTDGPINAVVVRDFDRAREQAKARDTLRAVGTAGPLNGVPMTVKESYNIAGLRTTWGFEHARDFVAPDDARTVARLKAAGAVILGKTNVPVALADVQSNNPIYGRTKNPHDLTRSPGGSSGGSAAALASGMVPLEFGSDIGGSIRTPCHFCGVMGLKPTYSAISSEGHYFPGTQGADPPLAMTGPMARTAEDLALALDLVSRTTLAPSRHTSFAGVRILVMETHPMTIADAAILGAIRNACDAAANAGAIISHQADGLPDLEKMQTDYWRMLQIAMAGRMPPTDRPAATVPEWFAMLDDQAADQRAFDRLFDRFDLIFAPVFGTTAFPHTDEMDLMARTLTINGNEVPFVPQFAWIGLATYPGLPSCAVPIGAAGGLPIGMQVIARHWADHTAIAMAGTLRRLLAY